MAAAMSDQTGLVHREADIRPGRAASSMSIDRSGRLIAEGGYAALRLFNDSDVERAYTVRAVSASNGYWRDEWVRMVGVDEPNLRGNRSDDYSEDGQGVTVFVTPGQSRIVAALFNLPESPEARAGLYSLKFVVEDSLLSRDGHGVREFPFTAIVRPVYDWSLEVQPDSQVLRYFRRRRNAEIFVYNRSNDWLYLDINVSVAGNVDVDAPVHRIAVPPPERTKKEYLRKLPVRFYSRIRVPRDHPIPVPITVSSDRLDAAGVPALPRDETQGMSGANLSAPVVYRPGQESARRSSPATLTYRPPVPKKWSDFVTGLRTGFMSLAGLVAIVLFMLVAVRLGCEHIQHEATVSWSQDTNAVLMPGDKISVRGKLVAYSKFRVLTSGNQTVQDWESASLDPRKTSASQEWQTVVKPSWPPGIVFVEVKPMSRIPILGSFVPLWGKDFSRPFEIKAQVPLPMSVPSPDYAVEEAGHIGILSGQNLTPKGTLSYSLTSGGGEKKLEFKNWDENEIRFVVPNLPFETAFIVTATREDGKKISWTLHIKRDPTLPAEGTIEVPSPDNPTGAAVLPDTGNPKANSNSGGGPTGGVTTALGPGSSQTASIMDAVAADTSSPSISEAAKEKYRLAAGTVSDPGMKKALSALLGGSANDFAAASNQARTDEARAVVSLLKGRWLEAQGDDNGADGEYRNRDTKDILPGLTLLFQAHFNGTGSAPDKPAVEKILKSAENLGDPEVKSAASRLRAALGL